ncbi:MAG: DNA-formamidopyrimidine glycosylase, partial [Planctomycetes bacterium]|nr:DNA-formamidopyrimidine glycosylase [Planctomycetota bacterium]
MPELPEVETIASQLRGRIVGRTISAATLERPDYLRSDVPGFPRLLVNRVVQGVTRQGKRMSVLLDNGATLLFHLGMSGRVTFEPIGSVIAPHTHFRIRFRQVEGELRMRDPRRFGGIWYARA